MNKLRNDLSWKVQEHFSCGKVTVTFFRTLERRSRCKRNKWKGPTHSVGRRPFMADCFLTVAERSDPLPISASHPKLTDLTEDAPASRTQLLTISQALFKDTQSGVGKRL